MPSATEHSLASQPPDLSKQLPRLLPRQKPKPAPEPTTPAPETPPLPPPPPADSIVFTHPHRRILSQKDHDLFLASPTYTLLTFFIFSLSDSVRGVPASAVEKTAPVPGPIQTVLTILDEASDLLKEAPPEDTGGSRFGNKAFRTYLDLVQSRQAEWHARLGLPSPAAVDEVSAYLQNSFGNRTRIDYGSGHELNFILWLLCLNRLGLLPSPAADSNNDSNVFSSLVLRVFARYLRLMRAVQTTYYLEPAGSHGVWGLDDYQFLPFLFGAAQLVGHRFIRPKSIHQSLVLEEYGKEYMYLDQVAFVNSVKNVEGLRWHSPMLDDISAAKSWEKVEAGMRKMFVAEVLGKLPVMQHFLFGALIPAAEGMSEERRDGDAEEGGGGDGDMVVMEDGMKHEHTPNAWGDCCGIKVPSSVGATLETKKRFGDGGLRRIPFD